MRKFFKGLIYTVIGLAVLVFIVSLTPLNYLIKGVYATYLHGENSATINDKEFFETELVRSDARTTLPWPVNLRSGLQPSPSLDTLLHETRTVAFAVFQHDTLVYEEYAQGYSRTSRTNSFSMAKTVTAMLAEIAIENGSLHGWDQRVIELLPDLQGPYAEELTLDDLSKMRAGLDWNEHYTNAFGITAKAYYGENVHELLMNEVAVINPPGEVYEYQSGATQLLGECVEAATGRSLAELASDWLWTPARAEDDAEWSTDDSHQILSYCCFHSNALDFARLGHILLHKGYWKNHLYMDSSATKDFFNPISTDFYGRSIWLGEVDHHPFSYFRGVNGQFIIMVPDIDAVIVRLGHDRGPFDGESTVPLIVSRMVKEYLEKLKE